MVNLLASTLFSLSCRWTLCIGVELGIIGVGVTGVGLGFCKNTTLLDLINSIDYLFSYVWNGRFRLNDLVSLKLS